MLLSAWLMLSSLLYSLQLSTGSFPKPLTEEEVLEAGRRKGAEMQTLICQIIRKL